MTSTDRAVNMNHAEDARIASAVHKTTATTGKPRPAFPPVSAPDLYAAAAIVCSTGASVEASGTVTTTGGTVVRSAESGATDIERRSPTIEKETAQPLATSDCVPSSHTDSVKGPLFIVAA